jgi:hypothetical protein
VWSTKIATENGPIWTADNIKKPKKALENYISYEISGAFFNVRGRGSFFIATKTPSPSWVAPLAQKAAPHLYGGVREKFI